MKHLHALCGCDHPMSVENSSAYRNALHKVLNRVACMQVRLLNSSRGSCATGSLGAAIAAAAEEPQLPANQQTALRLLANTCTSPQLCQWLLTHAQACCNAHARVDVIWDFTRICSCYFISAAFRSVEAAGQANCIAESAFHSYACMVH